MTTTESAGIEPRASRVDLIFEIAGVLILASSWVLIAIYYTRLPDVIPTHFNIRGEADGFGSKATLWILPAISLVLYVALGFMHRLKQSFNYPYPITAENRARQVANTLTMMRGIRIITALLFCYMTYATVANALGQMQGVNMLMLPIFLAAIFGCTGFFIYRGFRLR